MWTGTKQTLREGRSPLTLGKKAKDTDIQSVGQFWLEMLLCLSAHVSLLPERAPRIARRADTHKSAVPQRFYCVLTL